MDAAPYMMTNVNQASSTAPALLSTPHHHSPHQHPPPPHSIQIQYQSPPINHSVPLLATPMIGVSSIMDSHCLTSTPSGTFVNPTRLTSDNDPQQLQQPHVMILGMVATQPLDKGYSSQDQLTNMDQSNSMDASLQNGLGPGNNDPDQLRTALRQQLEYYFSNENLSHDVYLLTQMDSEQYVPISIIAGFDKVRKLTDDMDLIVQVLRESQVVQVDERGTKVKPIRDRKGVLILREIVDGTTNEEVESLFDHESCPRFVSVEFICNRNWYVTFDSDEDAHRALQYLTEHVKDFKGRPILARIKARTTIQAYTSNYNKNGARSPVMGMTSALDQQVGSVVVGRQQSSDGGTYVTTTTPVQGYPGPYFQPQPAMLQTWAPGATACYDLSSVINFNGLSPQLAYKPITTNPGPRQQYSRGGGGGGYQGRKNYYNHNGPRNHSAANNSYQYNPHLQQQQQQQMHQQQQTAPLVSAPHSIQQTVSGDPGASGGYLEGTPEPHYVVVNGNSINLPSGKGSSSQRVSAQVPHFSNPSSSHSGQPVVVNAHSTVSINQGSGYQTHSFNPFKPQSQSSSEPVVVNSSSNFSNNNSYQSSYSSGPRNVRHHQHSRTTTIPNTITTQQLNYQVPEFVPSNPVVAVNPAVEEVLQSPPEAIAEAVAPVEPEVRHDVPQPAPAQAVQSNGHYNTGGKGTSKGAQSSGNLRGFGRNRGGGGGRGGDRTSYRRDGDSASNCSGASGQSENYSRNGEDNRNNNGHGRHRDNRRDRDHNHRDHGRGTRNDPHSNEVVITPPTFDLKDAAFPPLPFSNATNDASTPVNPDAPATEQSVTDTSTLGANNASSINCATGSLADVVKGISISQSECNKSEASQKPFDSSSSSNDVIDGQNDSVDCNGSSPPSSEPMKGAALEPEYNVLKSVNESQNRWVRPPRASNAQCMDTKNEQNGAIKAEINKELSSEDVQPCNGHESSDNDDQHKATNPSAQSSKHMSFADVARLAKSKQPDNIASTSASVQRNSVGKESISSVASTVSNSDSNTNVNNTSQSKPGQHSKHSNRGGSGRDAKDKGRRGSNDGHRGSDGDNNNSRPPRERRDRNKGSRRGAGGGGGGGGGAGSGSKQDSRPGSRQSVGSSRKGDQVR